MPQKIVIKMQMVSDKCRSKAMALVAAMDGVDSVALAGDEKDQVVVVGDRVDSVKLTSALRKKVGPAQLVQVGDAKKAEEKKKEADVVEYTYHPGYYYYQPNYYHPSYDYQYHQYHQYSRPGTCSIM